MSDAIVAVFNEATTWAQVLTAIESNAAALLETFHIEKLASLRADGDREQALGLGVNEIKILFGNFASLTQIKAVVERQIDIEYAKHDFVFAFRTAGTAEDIRIALERIQPLYDDREGIIQEWSSSDDPIVRARAAELEAELYTTVLRTISARLGDGAYLDALAAQMMLAHQENGPFDNLDSVVQALDDATDALESRSIITSFNEAADWEAMLAAIIGNASTLLDPYHLAKLEQLYVDVAYVEAIGLGVIEIKTLFGDFTSPEQITAAVGRQIDMVHGRFAALTAINGSQDANSMGLALSIHVARINQHRQALIAEWLASSDPDAVVRANELKAEAYTTILSEVSSHLGNEDYLAELADRMQSALQGDLFHDTDALIAALDLADRAIDAAHDAVISGASSGAMSEDDQQSIGGLLTIEDGDWGESRFKAVAESELQKEYGTFTFDSTTGEWTFTLNSAAQSLGKNQQIEQTLTVESLDGTAATTITVTVTGQNDAPEAAETGNRASSAEDTVMTGQVPPGADIDGGELTYTLVQPVQGLKFNDDGAFSYQPVANFNGTVTFQYQVVDADGAQSPPRTFTITVSPVNDRPHDIVLSNTAVEENATAGTLVGALEGFDVDRDTLTFSLTNDADGRFAISNGRVVVKDGVRLDHEQATAHTLTVQVKDGSNAAYQETFIVDVKDDPRERAIGSSSSDLLKGGSGRDTLWGRLGNDQLTGGSGKDVFVFDTKPHKSRNKDKLVDFKVEDDTIWLDNKVFTKLGKQGTEKKPAKLIKDFFVKGAKSKDKNDYVIYDSKKGKLFYDPDGSGKSKQVEITALSKNLKMTEKDFLVI
ncbi:Ig-like domain-containing protein [Microvirga splendida]|uniref:VCBS domain-containing protein n=1 Tax=Microvirga splendida TaxID=2795727 RepID=A0ABS0XXZ9_9HYPH|nr:Ig-like domain-containing protein [Microvirga splendida]MBJ6124934.1 VCBS domain-containing protein [Microvirga splendida]